MAKNQISLTDLADQLPPIISRSHVGKLLGGVISSRRLANLDSIGEGPPRFKISGRVVYRTEELLTWLSTRSCNVEQGDTHAPR